MANNGKRQKQRTMLPNGARPSRVLLQDTFVPLAEPQPHEMDEHEPAWPVGSNCDALFADDGLWYPAKVMHVSTGGIVVRFYGYGMEQLCQPPQLRSLSEQYVKVCESDCDSKAAVHPCDAATAPEHLAKYWAQRYRLFSLFDRGIRIDEEGWYSVTPEAISVHIAKRCACSVLIDPFAGVGGNVIQFAKTCDTVIAIDINAERLAIAKHNAEVYGVAHKIEFILGDAIQLLPHLKADVVFLSPPWGGPGYIQEDTFGLKSLLPIHGADLFRLASTVTPNVVMFLPRNVDVEEVAALGRCNIEYQHVNKSLKTITAYFGELQHYFDDDTADGSGPPQHKHHQRRKQKQNKHKNRNKKKNLSRPASADP